MVEAALGVPMQAGGKHALFGTHNLLMGLAEGLYLEVIAIDPEAEAPGRARWFDLDNFEGAARLGNWICRTDDLGGVLAALPDGAGEAVALSRGDLRWQMAVPKAGRLPFDECQPALIEWQGALHPAMMLVEQPVRLLELVVVHPEVEALRAQVAPMLADARVRFEAGARPGLRAEFETPLGRRVLV